jgi:UDP-3-O-[3-hydroxymyristoyl] N-acetylglucosamine deacetylase
MKAARQTTLRDRAVISGVGVHSGLPVNLTLHPAVANTGIVFTRTDEAGRNRKVRADYRSVTATDLATVLGDADGILCSTAEHILAALRGLGVDNALVALDGPEVPIVDGSAAPFVAAIDKVGIVALSAPRRYIEVLKPVRVTQGAASGELRPYAHGMRLEIEIDFDTPLIGHQIFDIDVTPDNFRHEIARARTFGFMKDVSALWKAGKALGASLDNTVVLGDDRVMNAEGLRYDDEFVRHKALDALGDLALSGVPLLGAYRSLRGGHKLNHSVLVALMADPTAWRLVEANVAAEAPRRIRGRADVATGIAAPVYSPDLS